MTKIYSIFILLCSVNYTSLGQTLPTLQNDRYYGESWQDEGRALLQNLNGDYVLFGNIRHFLDQRGTDIFFVEMDQELRVGLERRDIGGRKDDVVNAAIQTFDGSYVLVGYTEDATENHLGGKDAWLLKMREDGYGDPLLDINLGSKADDEFHAVRQDSAGNLIACGTQDGKFWVVKWDRVGVKIWEKVYPTDFSAAAHDLIINRDNSITVTGYETLSRESYRALTLKINPTDGRELWSKRAVIDNARATAIIPVQRGGYAITGSLITDNEENVLLAKISVNGSVLWTKSYGGKYNGEDISNSLVQLENGNFMMTGATKSYFSRGGPTKLWLSITDQNGEESTNQAYGGRLNDVGNDLLLTQENQLLVAGASASGKKTQFTDAWMMQFPADTFPTSVRAPVLKIENIELVDPDNNNRLDPNERAYVAFDLVNKSTVTAYGLSATVSSEKVRGVSHYTQLQFGHLRANRRRRLAIPVRSAADVQTGISRLRMQLTSVNGGQAEIPDFAIESLREALPELQLTDAEFITNTADGRGQLDQPHTLRLLLKNTGLAAAERVRIKFSFPEKVSGLSPKQILIEELPAGATEELEFTFQASKVFLKDSLRIACRVRERTENFGLYEAYFLQIQPPTAPLPTEEVPPVTATAPIPPTEIQWDMPEIKLTVNEPLLPVKLNTLSETRVNSRNIRLYLNGERYQTGVKTDVVRYQSGRGNCRKVNSGRWTCYFAADINLPVGKHQLRAEVVEEDKVIAQTEILTITYERQPVALHILSIGVNYPNQSLRYTDEDARDIAARYTALKGTAFTEVYPQILTTVEETTKQSMEDALNELKNRFEYAEAEGVDRSQDVVIVFISGHGFIENRELYLEGSDNDKSNRNSRSLMLENNIIHTLKGLPCEQKVVLIDACRKNYRQSDKRYEFRLGADIPVFFSTAAGEVSYEDDSWKNGAFSEAILAAYANPQAVDKDKDKCISTWELYGYLYESVPSLVRAVPELKAKSAQQVPYLDPVFMDSGQRIFYY